MGKLEIGEPPSSQLKVTGTQPVLSTSAYVGEATDTQEAVPAAPKVPASSAPSPKVVLPVPQPCTL